MAIGINHNTAFVGTLGLGFCCWCSHGDFDGGGSICTAQWAMEETAHGGEKNKGRWGRRRRRRVKVVVRGVDDKDKEKAALIHPREQDLGRDRGRKKEVEIRGEDWKEIDEYEDDYGGVVEDGSREMEEIKKMEKSEGKWWGWMWGVVAWIFGAGDSKESDGGNDVEDEPIVAMGGRTPKLIGDVGNDVTQSIKQRDSEQETSARTDAQPTEAKQASDASATKEKRSFFGFGGRRKTKQKKKLRSSQERLTFMSYGDMREEQVYHLIRQAIKRRARVSKGSRDELATILPYDLQRTLFDEMIACKERLGKENDRDKGKSGRRGDEKSKEGRSMKGKDIEEGKTGFVDQSSEILLQLRRDLEQLDQIGRKDSSQGKQRNKKQNLEQNKTTESKARKNAGIWNFLGRAVGALLHIVGFSGDAAEASANTGQDTESKAMSRRAAAYAVALSREMESTDESQLSRGASSAFAAASAIASSASKTRREEAEAAGLNASVSAARAVRSIEDATVFVETVGVGPLVTAAHVLRGPNHSAALTALANLAIILPSSRSKILRADGSSIRQSIVEAVERSIGFRIVPNEKLLWHMEALVSGVHLLGSLALTAGRTGAAWRRKVALDDSLIQNLKKLANGLKPGEPEGAARAARRALGALGVNEWTPRVPGQRGLRILAIDGGGTRAIMSFEMLKALKKLTGCEIHEMFDVIGGTSTGAIVAASLGLAHKTVEEVEVLYRDLIGKVFARHPVNGPKLLLTRAFYDTNVLEETLKRECGRGVFIDSVAEENMNKVFVVSSIMSKSPQELHLFRNYTYPLGHESRYEGTVEAELWEALRASSAAPTFFSEIRINDELHADGAIVANNPAAVAVHEAKCMYPGVPIEILVSMGNGQVSSATGVESATLSGPGSGDQKRHDEESNGGEGGRVKSVGWGEVFGSIVASATSTETVHHALLDLFPGEKYFRFNPVTQSTQIDETRPGKLRFFVEDAKDYINAERERFNAAANILRPKRRRGVWSWFADAVQTEMKIFGAILDGEDDEDDTEELVYPD